MSNDIIKQNSHFEQQYPQNTRTAKLRQLKSSYESTNKLLVRARELQTRLSEWQKTPYFLNKINVDFFNAYLLKISL